MMKFGRQWPWAGLPLFVCLTHCNSTSGASGDGGTPADGASASGSDSATTPIVDASSPTGDATDAAEAAAPVVCNFPAGIDGGPHTFGPADPNIRYVGRIDLASLAPNVSFSESASYVTANFVGDAVSVMIDFHNGGVVNYFETIIDNYPPQEIPHLPTAIAQHIVPVAPAYDDAGAPIPLPCGTHKITLVKRTEADYQQTDFEGFSFAEILPPDPPPPHKIEIIGDSITCGAGVEALSANDPACSDGFGEGVENGYYAYGPDLARTLNAEWHVTCASGIGLTRNYYSRGDQRTMPQIYPYLDPEVLADTTPWPTTQWAASAGAPIAGTPDAIVIGLGTNDFSRDTSPLSDGGFTYRDPVVVGSLDGGFDGGLEGGSPTLEQGYVLFIDQLKAYYPGVSVFLVSSPILGDMYPTPTDLQLSEHQQAIKDVANYYTGDPAVHVYAVVIPKVIGTGCGGHPSVVQQAAGATVIANAIQSALNW